MVYNEEEMLMLSGIQHYVFCPRQWALIHIDQEWSENHLTIEGSFEHKNADNPSYRGIQKDIIVIRHVSLSSVQLGVYGFSDIIELHETNDKNAGIFFKQYNKTLTPYPIEYKHGRPKMDDCDVMQLVCQMVCIEEKFGIQLKEGALYYWKTRRRLPVEINKELRERAKKICEEMHQSYKTGKLPSPPSDLSRCRRCSLLDLCNPYIHHNISASAYIKQNLYEETT